LPGTTVRVFLRTVWLGGSGGARGDTGASIGPETDVDTVVPAGAETARPADAGAAPDVAADLAAIYELARYSGHTVDDPAARRFETLAAAFGAAVVATGR
jgi:hypothetical protein